MMGLMKGALVSVWAVQDYVVTDTCWLLGYFIFLFGSCKGKTTSNKFYKINLNLLQVFMFRTNNFSTLDDIFATVC